MSDTPESEITPVTRVTVAKLLVHGMTGDSWGVQEALIDAKLSLTEGWPLWWHAGQLLRAYLTADGREELVEQIRQEIIASRLVEDRGERTDE